MKKQDTFEDMLSEALRRAGEEHDKELMDTLMETDEAELRSMTAAPRKIRWHQTASFRAMAACLVLGVIIYGVSRVSVVNPSQNGYATLFNEYYHTPDIDLPAYDAGGDRLNNNNALSTKGVLEKATKLMAQPGRRGTRQGIAQLEELLRGGRYRKDLEHEVRWYLALGYVKDGQTAHARQQLGLIPRSSCHYKDAQHLLADLK